MRYRGADAPVRPVEVRAHDVVESVTRTVFVRPADPGVRDERVERAVDRGADLRLVADVAGTRRGSLDDVAQPRLVAGEEREPRTLCCDAFGNGATDARPGSGDDDVSAFESQAGEFTEAALSAERSASAVTMMVRIATVFSVSTTVSTERVS